MEILSQQGKKTRQKEYAVVIFLPYHTSCSSFCISVASIFSTHDKLQGIVLRAPFSKAVITEVSKFHAVTAWFSFSRARFVAANVEVP